MNITNVGNPSSGMRLTERWVDADARVIASLIARLSEISSARERRFNLVANFLAVMRDHRWSAPKFQEIFNAIDRLVRAGTLPLAGPVEAELMRVSAMEAADFIAEHKHDFPSDAETEYWINEAIRLSKLCVVRSSIDKVGQAIDMGQSLDDVAPMLAEISATDETSALPRSILDCCHNVADLLADPKPLAEPIIDGGLRRGEVGLWVGATKTAKSWSIMHWHIAIATGGNCFNYPCRRGAGLMIDCELALPTNTHRLKRVAELYGSPDLSSVELVSFREDPITIDGLIRLLDRVQPRRFDFITIDPIFKLLPADADENNNAFIASFFSRLIALATKLDCAILCVHHTSKGLQSGKSVSDLGAGAGAQSRAVDWHCGLREHAEAGCVSLHTLCRSFPPTDPSVWELTPPAMTARPELDPDVLKQPKPRKPKPTESAPATPPKPTWMTAAGLLTSDEPKDAAWFSAELGISERTTKELLRQAVAKSALHIWAAKDRRNRDRWARVPMPLTGQFV